MAKDFFLYQVGKRWYQAYWAFMTLVNLGIVVVFVAGQFIDSFGVMAGHYQIGRIAAVIAGISLLYLGVIFWAIAKYSWPFAVLIGAMLFSMGMLYGLANTEGSYTYPYIIGWLVSAALSGTFGLPLLLGGALLTFVFITLQSDYQISAVDTNSFILMGGELVIILAAYLFWKGRFVNVEEQQMNQLSGMLKSSKQQSEILIQSIADGVIVTNTDGKITLMNPAAATMTEWSVADATGVDAQLIAKLAKENGEELTPDENPFSVVLKQQKHVNHTLQLKGQKGKQMVISLVISPVTLPGSMQVMGAVAVMRDISEERAAEKQSADFISTASHEMRTPVAAIEGYLSLALNEKVSTIDSRARGYLEKAHTSTQHLGKLFQDLLTSSKAEDGRLSNHPGVVEMGEFLQQLTDDLKFSAEKKGLLSEFLIGGSNEAIDATNKDVVGEHVLKPLYYVYADPDRMREVITNLFDNASKYTESGKISIGLTGDNEVVQMYIRDTGSGIPAEDIPHLFQKFYRVDNSATRTIGGTGLGLFICRKIVELYHGRIWVESEVGKGSTFFINLPRLSTQRAQSLMATEAGASASPEAKA